MYAKIQDQTVVKYPYTFLDMRMDNPLTSFPESPTEESLREFNVVVVQPVGKPIVDYLHSATEDVPTILNGTWTQVWVVSDATAAEIADRTEERATSVRFARNAALTNSDWTQVADAPVDKAIWAEYRQQLRDVTAQQGFPFSVVWPVQPV